MSASLVGSEMCIRDSLQFVIYRSQLEGGRALPARAPHDCGLLGRGLREALVGAAGGPVRDRAHV
eukprot:8134665-Alexandrium_andersonii.AAC.1